MREEAVGAERHDLALRAGIEARNVIHVPEVLSRRADASPVASDASVRVVQEHFARQGHSATVTTGRCAGLLGVQRDVPPTHRVSLVLVTRGEAGIVSGRRRTLVLEAVRSLLEHTNHPLVEVVVVHDETVPTGVLAELRALAGDQLVLVASGSGEQRSSRANAGAVAASGNRLVFLHDDVEATSPGWLENLIGPLEEDAVGITGAKLLHPDHTIEHAGVATWAATYVHPFRGYTSDEPGPFGELIVNREVSAVSPACLAIRAETFAAVGGFSEVLADRVGHLDLCHKVRSAGARVVWASNAELAHPELRSRGLVLDPGERLGLARRWGTARQDPYLPKAAVGEQVDTDRFLLSQM